MSHCSQEIRVKRAWTNLLAQDLWTNKLSQRMRLSKLVFGHGLVWSGMVWHGGNRGKGQKVNNTCQWKKAEKPTDSVHSKATGTSWKKSFVFSSFGQTATTLKFYLARCVIYLLLSAWTLLLQMYPQYYVSWWIREIRNIVWGMFQKSFKFAVSYNFV